jgi:hypothetical protein
VNLIVTVLPAIVGTVIGCVGAGTTRSTEEAQASAQGERGPQGVKIIDRSVLKTIVEEGGYVAIVRITDAAIMLEGTRSEAVVLTGTVLHELHGELGDTVTIERYTSKGDVVLQPGMVYAVALELVPVVADNPVLSAYVPVTDDAIDDSAEQHRAALAELGG